MAGKDSPRIVVAGRLPAMGKHFRIEMAAEERRLLAQALGIEDVTELTADLHLRPLSADAYELKGTLSADVVQTDVVTLEPVRQSLREEIDLTLLPAEATDDAGPSVVGVDAAERDTYRNGKIDLGAIVQEHLALGLDPYPRAEGVEFPGHVEDADAPDSSPFAALAPLKPKPD